MCEFESHWSHHGDTTNGRPTDKKIACVVEDKGY